MKFEIELTAGTARRIGRVAATLAVLGVGAAVYASQTHFTSGQTLTADALNHNFDELYAAAAKSVIVRNGKSISIGGTYCGTSADKADGALVGGYTAAKATCETTCTSATAHMCDAAEIVRSQQLGIPIPGQQWVNSFSSTDQPVDCSAWTSAADNESAMVWNPSPPRMYLDRCNNKFPIACCD